MRHLSIAAIALTLTVTGWAEKDRWVDEAEADLDGDGIAEQVSLVRLDRKPGAFTLSVNGASITDRIVSDWPIDGVSVVDIRTGDGLREIAVYTRGGGEDPATWYFWYNGSELHRTGLVDGALSAGSYGRVRARNWQGFWSRETDYVLYSRTHTLSEVPQEFYLVDIAVNVARAHPIYRTRELQSVAGRMTPGARVRIIASDCRGDYGDWRYLVKLPDDTTGWLSGQQAMDSLVLPLAD